VLGGIILSPLHYIVVIHTFVNNIIFQLVIAWYYGVDLYYVMLLYSIVRGLLVSVVLLSGKLWMLTGEGSLVVIAIALFW
jgi:hypothetical protein